jgi:hypothetical protein
MVRTEERYYWLHMCKSRYFVVVCRAECFQFGASLLGGAALLRCAEICYVGSFLSAGNRNLFRASNIAPQDASRH